MRPYQGSADSGSYLVHGESCLAECQQKFFAKLVDGSQTSDSLVPMHTRKTYFHLEDGRKVLIPSGLRVRPASNLPASQKIKWWLDELTPRLSKDLQIESHFRNIGFGFSDEEVMQMPVVTLNGSTAESLAREYSEARQAIERAISAVPYPHGRDYPSATQDAFGIAYEQYKKLIDFLRAAAVEMEAIEEFLSK